MSHVSGVASIKAGKWTGWPVQFSPSEGSRTLCFVKDLKATVFTLGPVLASLFSFLFLSLQLPALKPSVTTIVCTAIILFVGDDFKKIMCIKHQHGA